VKQSNDPHDPKARALDEALALWSEDARAIGARAAGTRAGHERLANAVAARIAANPTGDVRERVPFGYAAAAAALLAIGITGAFLSQPAGRTPAPPNVSPDLEQGTLAVIRLVELEQIPVGR
jgi:hypothetical protein